MKKQQKLRKMTIDELVKMGQKTLKKIHGARFYITNKNTKLTETEMKQSKILLNKAKVKIL